MPTAPATPKLIHRPTRDRSDERVLDLGRLLIGAAIVTLGALFLLDAANVLDAGKAIDDWWPALILAAGALTLLERPPSVLRGSVLVGIGGVLLLFTTGTLGDDAWNYVWPAALILFGLAIVARWSGRTIPKAIGGEEVIRSTAVFSGSNVVSTARNFKGAWLTAIFGGIVLDLRGATPTPEGATVNATVAFGGADVIVPRGWRISVRSTPLFGGVDDKTDHSRPLDEDAPTLYVDAVPIFGGVAVKHDKDDD
jgi:hypothetical protein